MQRYYSVNVGKIYYYISKCMKRMQIRWNAASFKNRYTELLELEQYKVEKSRDSILEVPPCYVIHTFIL